MKKALFPVSLLFTPVLPAIHFALCVFVERGNIDDGWIFMSVVDFPVSFFLFGLTFRDGRAMLWFGVFGTLWWLFLSLGVWALWRHHRRRTEQARPSAGP